MVGRFLVYGMLGWCLEVVWTALYEAVTGTRRAHEDVSRRVPLDPGERWNLTGKTHLWVFPLYGAGLLAFERLHEALRAWPALGRGAVYMAAIFGLEAGAGLALRAILGRCPWDYSYARTQVAGVIRLDYAPLWFGLGLLFERVHDGLRLVSPPLFGFGYTSPMQSLLLVLALAAPPAAPPAPAVPTPDPAVQLLGGALVGGQSYAIVESLTDHVGQRLAGSPAADRAVKWALEKMRALGLENVHTEPVRVPHWVRGDESAELVAASPQVLHVTALGGSVGTPPAGLSAEVVEVTSLEEAQALGARARGKIVLYNKKVERSPHGSGYGSVVGLRHGGGVAAARLGAVAALIRSVGTGAYRLAHTGATSYEDGVAKIPFAAVAAEDAELLHRRLAAGETVRVRLKLGARRLADVDSANVVGELVGRERPGEVVLIGAHLDSWDLGQGAIDDGAGCAIVLETGRLIRGLAVRPRRTVRVVLFMNEEGGLSGARAYAERHQAEVDRHVAAMEADSGAGRPLGFSVIGEASAPVPALVKRIAAPLGLVRVGEVTMGKFGGADLMPLQALGVPIVEMNQDGSAYFDWHHTAADTLDKIDPFELALDAGALAVMTFGLADAVEVLPRLPPAARQINLPGIRDRSPAKAR